jgi:UDP-N-acetylmuramate dehydrogenase
MNLGLLPYVSQLVAGRVRTDLLGRSVTTICVGGALPAVVTVESCAELSAVLRALHGEGERILVLGNGSNLLIPDGGIDGWVVRLGSGFKGITSSGNGLFLVGGAAPLMPTARRVCGDGFSGLEFAAGIPASVGGAAWMNAGAHGSEIGERVDSIRGFCFAGEFVEISGRDIPWRYRAAGLPRDLVVTEVTLRLAAGNPQEISRSCEHFLHERKARQPLALPSAGSVFKNPTASMPAGRVLEEAGVKGLTEGGAQVSTLHANWIVNPAKEASAADVQSLIASCQAAAAQKGYTLHPEVQMW